VVFGRAISHVFEGAGQMKGFSKTEKKKKKIFKIRTKVKAGVYLGLTFSGGSGGISTRS
jgi:hypothetical protein